MHWDLLLSKKSSGRSSEPEDLKEWLVKLTVHLEKEIGKTIRRNRKKLKKLCSDET